MPSTSPNRPSIRNASLRGVWPAAAAAPTPTMVTAAAPIRSSLRIGFLSTVRRRHSSYGPAGDEIVADRRSADKISVITAWEAVSRLAQPRRGIDRAFVAAQFEGDLAVRAGAAQNLAVGHPVAGLDGRLVQPRNHGAPAGSEIQDHHLTPAAQGTGEGDPARGGRPRLRPVGPPAPAGGATP